MDRNIIIFVHVKFGGSFGKITLAVILLKHQSIDFAKITLEILLRFLQNHCESKHTL